LGNVVVASDLTGGAEIKIPTLPQRTREEWGTRRDLASKSRPDGRDARPHKDIANPRGHRKAKAASFWLTASR